MIKLKKHQTNTPVVTEMELAGCKFEIELTPIEPSEVVKLFTKFRKWRNVYNPISKQMEIQHYIDDTDPEYLSFTDNLLDKIVKNFKGISDENGNPLDGTVRENKLLLGSVKVEDVEDIEILDEAGGKSYIKQKRIRFFRSLIFDKAMELAAVTAESEIKNL